MGVTHCRNNLKKRQFCRMKSDSYFRFPRKYGMYTNSLKARLSVSTLSFLGLCGPILGVHMPLRRSRKSFASLTELPLSEAAGRLA
jgi:hypothetical protein